MGPIESLASLTAGNVLSALVLGWLAFFFGRTLFAGRVPLIERVARVSEPSLSPALCSYTRRLTGIWSLYFVVAALLSVSARLPFWLTSGCVWLGAVALFVGEHQLRRVLYPGLSFPGLLQQVKDTLSVWQRAV